MNRVRNISRQYAETCKPERPSFVPNWSNLDRTALRRACARRGIVYSQMTKAQMIVALSANQRPAVVRPAKVA